MGDKGVDFGEGVGRDDVDAVEGAGEGGGRVAVEGCEEEDEEDEAVFPAVVREGELVGAGEC